MSKHRQREFLVLAASVDFDGPRLSEQHVALALAQEHNVLYLDPPRTSWTRHAGFAPGRQAIPFAWSVREVVPGLTRATLGIPPGIRRPALLPSIDRWRGRLARRLVGRRGAHVAAVLSAAARPSVFTGFPGARRVFWAKDDYVAGAGLLGMNSARIAAGQAATARVVDAAIAVTPGLRELWSGRVADAVLIPGGSDPGMTRAALDAARPADIRLPAPIAGFVGQVSDRIDLGLLEAVAATGASLLLVGRRQATFGGGPRFDALLAAANVQWTGPRDYDELPGYLGAIDVGLVPYTDSEFNRASFPLKLLEYLSVGAGVVATDLPAVRWLDSAEVTVASAGQFAAAVSAGLALAGRGGPELAARQEARRVAASAHTWSARAAEFADVLGLSEPERSEPAPAEPERREPGPAEPGRSEPEPSAG